MLQHILARLGLRRQLPASRPRRHTRRLSGEQLEQRALLSAVVGLEVLNSFDSSGHVGEKPESKIWQHAGKWWGVFSDNVGTHVWRLDGLTWSKTLQLSSDVGIRVDVKSQGNVAHIFYSNDLDSKLASVQFVPGATPTYEMWPDRPALVGVPLSQYGETATIDIDTTGRMWVTYQDHSSFVTPSEPSKILVKYSDAPYSTWSAPITLASGIFYDDLSAVIAMPGGKIGVFWSDQERDQWGFRMHVDGTDPTVWTADETPAKQYQEPKNFADDHMNVKVSSDGTLYVAVKTSYDTPGKTWVGFLVRHPNGVWDDIYTIRRDAGTRPMIQLNEAAETLVYSYDDGNDWVYHECSTVTYVCSDAMVMLATGKNGTSTKQNVFTDLVALTSGKANGGKIAGVRLTFAVTNAPPAVEAGSNQTIYDTQAVSLAGIVSDDGKPNPPVAVTTIWSKDAGPGVVSFADAAAQSTSATFTAPGIYVLKLTASDGEKTGSDTVTITVLQTPANQRPVVTVPQNFTMNVSQSVMLDGEVSDDGLPLVPGSVVTHWSKTSGPGTVAFANADSLHTLTSFGQTGIYVIELSANDSDLIGTGSLTVTVTPSLINPGDRTLDEKTQLAFTLAGTAGGSGPPNPITYSIATGSQPGMTLPGQSGQFSWTPTESQDGAYPVTFRATDQLGLYTEQSISIVVREDDTPPQLTSPGDKMLNEHTELAFTLAATDTDIVAGQPDSITYSIAAGSQSGMNLNAQTGEFRWTPSESQDGQFPVTLRATDSLGSFSNQTITITVQEVNDVPLLSNPGNRTLDEKTALAFTLAVTQRDIVAGQPDPLSFSIVSGSVARMTLNAQSGAFSWTPSETQEGDFPVRFRVIDTQGDQSEQSITITVRDVNEPPLLTNPGDRTLDEQTSLSFALVGTDLDVRAGVADTITYSIVGGEMPGMTLDAQTGAFGWTPSDFQDGKFPVRFRATDNHGALSERLITITVREVNEPPQLGNPGHRSLDEHTALAFTLAATDSDSIAGQPDSITYAIAAGTQTGMSLNAQTGEFQWTPTESQDGQYPVTLQATDSLGGTSEQSITISVREVNNVPQLTSPGNRTIDEQTALDFTLAATQRDIVAGQPVPLTYSIAAGTQLGMTINAQTGAFSWTPSETQDGEFLVTLRVDDTQGDFSERSITITVREVNAAPQLPNPGDQTLNEKTALSFTLLGNDLDVRAGVVDTIVYSIVTGNLPGMFLDNQTGLFSWTPTESQDGNFPVRFRATDNQGAFSERLMTITVGEVNDPPVLAIVGDRILDEQTTLALTLAATDNDITAGQPNSITYSIVSGARAGMSLNPQTGEFRWTPSESQDGQFPVTFRATDSNGGIADQPAIISVQEVNNPPVLPSLTDRTIDEATLLSFSLSGTDLDVVAGQADTVTYSIAAGNRPGMTINSETGVFSWTPSESQDGEYRLTYRATDNHGGFSERSLTIAVRDVNVPPQLITPGDRTLDELASVAFTLSATDNDVVAGLPDTIVYLLVAGSSPGMTFDPATGAFQWTPGESQDGTYPLTFRAVDNNGAFLDQSITITVREVNNPPQLANPGYRILHEQTSLALTLSATDGDVISSQSDAITYSIAAGSQTGMSLDAQTGVFHWTPSESQDGDYRVTFRATDSLGAFSEESIPIVVRDANNAPKLDGLEDQTIEELTSLSLTLTGTDFDVVVGQPDTISYSITFGARPGMTLNRDTGAFNWTPTESQDGEFRVTFRATDNQGGFSDQSLKIVVTDVNTAPKLVSPGHQTLDELTALSFNLVGSDTDITNGQPNTIAYSIASGSQLGMTLNPQTGAFQWTPNESQDGQYPVTFRTTDSLGAFVEQPITVVVRDINRAPVLLHPGNWSPNEKSDLAFSLFATDLDVVAGQSEVISYSIVAGTQPGMTVNAQSGEFRWTPTESQDGQFIVVFRAADNRGALADQTSTITVRETNDGPRFDRPENQTLDEQSALSFTLVATEDDVILGEQDEITFSILGGGQTGMTLDPVTGEFRWTPTESQDGVCPLILRAADNRGGYTDRTITITVREINDTPLLQSPGNRMLDERTALTFTLAATDGDVISDHPDTITYSIVGGNLSGMNLEPQTGVFRWTPTEAQDGQHPVTFRATDSLGSASDQSITISVREVNHLPSFESPGNFTLDELSVLAFDLTGSDDDIVAGQADALNYSITAGSQPGMTLNPQTGEFLWTPTELQDGEYPVTFRASDSNGAFTNRSITITVREINQAPVFEDPGDPALDEQTALELALGGSDRDVVAGQPDLVTYSISQGNQPGMTLNPASGLFRWTPTELQDGVFPVTFRATDGKGAVLSQSMIITVRETNAQPQLASPGDKTLDEKTILSFTLAGSDFDVVAGRPDTISYSITAGFQTGMTLNVQTGQFSWLPNESQDGEYLVSFRASDNLGTFSQQSIAITVREVNDVPLLNSPGNRALDELGSVTFTLVATEQDVVANVPDDVSYSIVSAVQPGMTLDGETGEFLWTTNESLNGEFQVIFRAMDSYGAISERSITIAVREINVAPLFASLEDQSLDELEELSFTVAATDNDIVAGRLDVVTYSIATGNQPGMTIDPQTGAFFWAPTESQDGKYPVTFRAADAQGAFSYQSITITVREVNDPPVLLSPGSKSLDELKVLAFHLTGADRDTETGLPDGITYSIAAGSQPGMLLDPQTGAFRWTPDEALDGEFQVTFRATDRNSAFTDQTIAISVREVNTAPTLVSPGNKTLDETTTLALTLAATDPDVVSGQPDPITYSITSGMQQGMSLDSATGEFRWVPGESQGGQFIVLFRAADSLGAFSDQSVTINVKEVNAAPQFTSPGDRIVDESVPLEMNLLAADLDIVAGQPDRITFSIGMGQLPGMTLDAQTGRFRWTPTESQDGRFALMFRAVDSQGASSETLTTITVREVNTPPLLVNPQDRASSESVTLAFTLVGSDSDFTAGQPDRVTYSLAAGSRPGMRVDPQTGEFNWTPGESQDGEYFITLRVTDTQGAFSDQSMKITIRELNRPPQLASLGNITFDESTTTSFSATAIDGDFVGGQPDTVVYSLNSDRQAGMSLDPNNGLFRWTPGESQDGQYFVTIRATDKAGAFSHQSFTITVRDVNTPPLLANPGHTALDEKTTASVKLIAVDDDIANGLPDPITFSIAAGQQPGMTLDSQTGDFRWTPSESQDGQHVVRFRATDSSGLFSDQSITVSVREVNEAPRLASPGDRVLNARTELSFLLTAADTDVAAGEVDAVTYWIMSGSRDGMSLNPSSGAFHWTPTVAQVGSFAVVFGAMDSQGVANEQTITITVKESNNPPTEISLSNREVKANENGGIVGTLSVTDPDAGQSHQYSTSTSFAEIDGATLKLKANHYLKFLTNPSRIQDCTLVSGNAQCQDLGVGTTVMVDLTVTDSGVPEQSLSQKLMLTVIATASWQFGPSDSQRMDTNGDGDVVPQDVLRVINQLNSSTILGPNGRLPDLRPKGSTLPFYDVNGDGFCTAVGDVLPVINFLNNRVHTGGEGEAAVAIDESSGGPIFVPLMPSRSEHESSVGEATDYSECSNASTSDQYFAAAATVDRDLPPEVAANSFEYRSERDILWDDTIDDLASTLWERDRSDDGR